MNAFELGCSPALAVAVWHVVRRGDTLGLCGHLLLPESEFQPIARLDDVPEVRRCADCWSAYAELLGATDWREC